MLNNRKKGLLFLLPSLCGFSMFYLLPFVGGMYFSLINNAFEKKFVGLGNFIDLLKSQVYRMALQNTFVFTLLCVPVLMMAAFLLAVLLRAVSRDMGLTGNAIVLPLAIPSASVIVIWNIFFEDRGMVNHILGGLGIQPLDWLGTDLLRWPVVLLYIWKNCGYCMILFMAGYSDIPEEIYEAASMDGAGWWRKQISVTLPLIVPTAFFVLIISIINSFKIFKETWLLGGAIPPDGVYLVQHYINHQMTKMNYEKLTTAAYIFAALIYVMVFFIYRWQMRYGRGDRT